MPAREPRCGASRPVATLRHPLEEGGVATLKATWATLRQPQTGAGGVAITHLAPPSPPSTRVAPGGAASLQVARPISKRTISPVPGPNRNRKSFANMPC